MTIRRLLPDDAAAYRELMLDAYVANDSAFTSTVEERKKLPLAWWAGRLEPGNAAEEMVFGAFEGERLVGVAGIGFNDRQRIRHKANLFGLVVRPECARRGHGRALIDATLHAARERDGVQLIQLTVTKGNHAATLLYAAMGFRHFATEPHAVVIDGVLKDKLHLWRPVQLNASTQ